MKLRCPNCKYPFNVAGLASNPMQYEGYCRKNCGFQLRYFMRDDPFKEIEQEELNKFHKKIVLESLNRRLTSFHDLYLANKAENNRLKRIAKREADYIYELLNDEFMHWDMIERIGHEGPYSFKEIFNYHYYDAIVDLIPSKVSLFSKIRKDDNWKGGELSLPKLEK